MTERIKHIYFFALFLGILTIMYFVFKPFIFALFIAVICSVMFSGTHKKIVSRIPNHKNISAILSVLAVLVFIIVPLGVITVLVFNEARDFYASFSVGSSPAGLLNQGLLAIQEQIQVYVPQANINLEAYIQSGLQWILEHASLFFSGFMKVVLDLFIMVIAMFYLFRDGKEIKRYVVIFSPLEEKDDEDILKKLEVTINSVIKGSLIIALVQGTCTAIGLYLFGVGQPILWGLVAAVASLVPGVGTALVHIPALIYLFITGDLYQVIGYGLWSALLIGSIDNVISPLLIERKVKIHPLLILVSVLGGLAFFGPIGFLAGPVILAFMSELIKLYPKFSN